MIEEQIEKLRTLQESYDIIADTVESQLPALADKIDNIQLPEIDTTELAKQATLDEVKQAVGSIKVPDLHGVVDKLSIGKQKIVNAINLAGGNATMDMDLSDLSEQVKKLAINGVPLIDEYNIAEFVEGYIPKSAVDIYINRDKIRFIESFYPFTELGKYQFTGCINLEHAILHNVQQVGAYNINPSTQRPSSVTTQSLSFVGCTNLKVLELPDTTSFLFSHTNSSKNLPLADCVNLEELILQNIKHFHTGSNSNANFGDKLKKT